MRRKQRTEPLLHASNSSVTKMIAILSVVVAWCVGSAFSIRDVVVVVVVVVMSRGGVKMFTHPLFKLFTFSQNHIIM